MDTSAWGGEGYVMTEAEKANTSCVDAIARPLLTPYTLLFLSYAKSFPGFGKNWKLIYHR
jgi:hypothetical protein